MPTLVPAKPPAVPSFAGFVAKVGWIIAAAMVLLTALFAARVATLNTQVVYLRQEAELARLEAQSLHHQLEAERILNTRQLADLANKDKSQNDSVRAP